MFYSICLSVLKGVIWLVYLIALLWCGGVIYFNAGLGYLGAVVFVAIMLLLAFFRKRVGGAFFLIGGIMMFVVGWFCSIQASGDGPWQKPWERMPTIERKGGTRIKVKNIRNFTYRTPADYDVGYVEEEYDLNDLRTIDFAISRWDGMTRIAHTMLSFGFSDGRYLALSVETRLPEGRKQGSIPGLFKQYNLIYLLAKEEDVFSLRTNYRKEEMRLYRMNLKPEKVRGIFMDFMQRINVLERYPDFYNTLTSNCSTELIPPFTNSLGDFSDPLSSILNGLSDRSGFEKGILQHDEGESFDGLQKRALIPSDISMDLPPEYSRLIREKVGIR